MGHPTDVIFVDLSKASDEVPHGRLPLRLQTTGFDDAAICWITDFLRHCSFSVKVFQSFPRWLAATRGAYQGSVFGLLLLLMYINYHLSAFGSPCLSYADDLDCDATYSMQDRPIRENLLGEDLDVLVSSILKTTSHTAGYVNMLGTYLVPSTDRLTGFVRSL